jgi:hypothetical protein
MSLQDVRVPVDVDTSKARSSLRQLREDKRRASKRIAGAARRSQRLALRAFAFAGAGSAVARFTDTAPVGNNVHPVAESLVPLRALWQQTQDLFLGGSVKARKEARAETAAAFNWYVGKTGDVAASADFLDTATRIRQQVESGRNLLRRDPRFIGPDFETASKAALAGNVQLAMKNLKALNPLGIIARGFDYLVEGITAE